MVIQGREQNRIIHRNSEEDSYRYDTSHTKNVARNRMEKKRKEKGISVKREDRENRKHSSESNKRVTKSSDKPIRNEIKSKVKESVSIKQLSSAEYSGNKEDKGSPEYMGNTQTEKKTAKTLMAIAIKEVLLLVKLIAVAISKILVVVVVVAVALVILVAVIIRNITYDAIANEEKYIREDMAAITSELSYELTSLKDKYGCENITTTGSFTDWKLVIAFWWAIKNNMSDTLYWDEFIEGGDKETLEYIFYQFNIITFETDGVRGHIDHHGSTIDTQTTLPEEQSNVMSKKSLHVTIENKSFYEMCAHWQLSEGQIKDLEEMLANDELWEEVLGSGELSQIAYNEIGNASNKYADIFDTSDISPNLLFVEYCLLEAGYINDNYIILSPSVDEMIKQLQNKGFWERKDYHHIKEGDLLFYNYYGEKKVGIVTEITGSKISFISCDFNKELVEELYMDTSNPNIESYASLGGGFFCEAMLSSSGSFRAGRVSSPRIAGTDTELTRDEIAHNEWYTSAGQNPFSGDNGLDITVGDRGGNCTAYVWGRRCEIEGERTELGTYGNAYKWYDREVAAGVYRTGQSAEVGAVCSWSYYNSQGGSPGHVAVIEVINEDGSIITSNSSWSGAKRFCFYNDYFENEEQLKSRYGHFNGYIYLDKLEQ